MNVLQLLRNACKAREPYWNPEKKELTSLYRSNELAGEVGELANAVKKLNRHEMGMPGGVSDQTNLKEEIGDVIISCILLADHYDVDVWDAVVDKFNKTSKKHSFPVTISNGDNFFWHPCTRCNGQMIGLTYEEDKNERVCSECRSQE